MFNYITSNQLHDLKLVTMDNKLREQTEQVDINSLSFDERFGILVEAEWLSRQTKRTNRFIDQATFRFSASIENIDFHGKRGITKQEIIQLCTGNYIKQKQNIIISGPTGIGKTYLVCAFGRHACTQNIKTLYLRISDLFIKLSDAQMQGSYLVTLKKIFSVPLLILDDWGLKKFTLEETHEIMEIVEHRYNTSSTIISGQLPYASWHDLFPDPTLADAILDRIIHNAHKINLEGESMRKSIGEHELLNNKI
jgi:DNA replication protein DnaC